MSERFVSERIVSGRIVNERFVSEWEDGVAIGEFWVVLMGIYIFMYLFIYLCWR